METQTQEVSKVQGFVPADTKKIEATVLKLSGIKPITTKKEYEDAEVILKDAKSFHKVIEAERKSFTVKIDAMKAAAMVHEKKISAALVTPELYVNNYVKAEEKKKQDEQAKIEKEQKEKADAIKLKADQKQALLDFELNTTKAIAACTTKKQIEDVHENLLAYKPAESKFGDHLNDAIEKRKELLKLSGQQKEAISKKKTLEIDVTAIEDKKNDAHLETAEKLQAVDMHTQGRMQSFGSSSGIKKNWTFEVENINKVPVEYLIVDAVKVNAAIKMGTREILGLRIFQEISRSGR